MATKTISLAEDAYERLKRMKREGESFSDVVRRLTSGVELADFHGTLGEETADDLESTISARRARHAEVRAQRRKRIQDVVDDS